jgi:hypothetical protein
MPFTRSWSCTASALGGPAICIHAPAPLDLDLPGQLACIEACRSPLMNIAFDFGGTVSLVGAWRQALLELPGLDARLDVFRAVLRHQVDDDVL